MRDSVELFREKYSEEMRAFHSEQEAEMFFRKHHRELPQFPLNRMLSKPNPTKTQRPLGGSYEKEIEISCIYGESWLFHEFDREYDEYVPRPLPARLAMLFWRDSDRIVVPVPLLDLGDGRYLADDGNHRIYSAYLRNWKTIPAYIERVYL